jgi:hypothetical protein
MPPPPRDGARERDKLEHQIKLLDVRVREIAALIAQQRAVLKSLGKAGRNATKAQEIVDHLRAIKRSREGELERLRKKLGAAK